MYTINAKTLAVATALACCTPSLSQDIDQFSLKKGVTASGGLSFNNTFYAGSDSLVRRDPYLYTLCGDLDLNVAGVGLPFSFALSNTDETYSLPFNRIQVTPQYKWVKLYLGQSALNFSPYTLAGHDMRGVGMELTPGNWYIGATYGRLNKAVEYDPATDNVDYVSYKRMGYAAKVGWTGSKTDVNATFFHGEDDPHSLAGSVPAEADLHPQENTAVSAYLRQNIGKHLFVQGEYAFSMFNSEIRTAEGATAHGSTFVDKVFGRKGNDRYVDALNAQIGWQDQLWGLSFCYERVAPYYQTLGGYYFTNDKEDFTLAPYLKLFKSKLNISGKFGLEYNNLNGMKSDNTHRLAGSACVAFNSGKHWNASLNYSNFSTYTRYKKTAYPYYTDELDSLNFYQVSQSLMGSVVFNFGDKERMQNIGLNASWQYANTEAGNASSTRQNVESASLNFSQNLTRQKLGWMAYASANYSDDRQAESLYVGPGASLNKSFFKDALNTSASCAYNVNTLNGARHSSLLNSNLSATWNMKFVKEKYGSHGMTGSVGLTNWLKKSDSKRKDYELLATVNYSVRF